MKSKKILTKVLSIALVCVKLIMSMGAYSGEVVYSSTEGVEYWKENGGANYIRYAVEEEPSGLGYLESFSLGTVSADNGSPQSRIINSYYVHTWEELNISVSIGVNTKSEVSLEITPSIVKSAWQLYSYVSFNF